MNAYRPSDYRTPRTLDTSRFGPYATLDRSGMSRIKTRRQSAMSMAMRGLLALAAVGAGGIALGQAIVWLMSTQNGNTWALCLGAAVVITVILHDVWADRR